MFDRIAILGFGLIGSSLARALRERAPSMHIAAFDTSAATLETAVKTGIAQSQHAHAGQAAQGAQLVIIASPPASFGTLAADIAPFLAEGAIVTDTGSVKRHAITAITPSLPKHVHFVPGHPIAGSEQRGIAAGRADLFAGKRMLLTPQEAQLKSDAVTEVRKFWELAGARVEFMPAELHDRIYAYVSHLPQLVAFACDQPMKDLPAPADETQQRFTRLMKSDPTLWAEICLANADYVGEAIDDFSSFASQMAGELSETPAAGGADAAQVAVLFPRVVATCLIATASLLQEITGVHPARYAGSGFADMTAPALSDPEAALSAISSHHWVIAKKLKSMLAHLQEAQKQMSYSSKEQLVTALKAAYS